MKREKAFPKTDNEQKSVKKEIKKILEGHDWFHWSPPANGFGASGISDIHAVWNGLFMVIEAKYGKGKPTPLQVGFLNTIQASGHFAFLVNETNLHWLDEFLTNLDFSTKEVQLNRQVPAEIGARMLDAIAALTELIPGTTPELPPQMTILHKTAEPGPEITAIPDWDEEA